MPTETELVFHSLLKRVKTRVPANCTGREVYEAIAAATELDYIHQLYVLRESLSGVERDAIFAIDEPVEPPLDERAVIVAQEKLIVWMMICPEEKFEVLHLWPGDMPDFLSDKTIFPFGAFNRTGELIDPEQEWTDGIVQVYSLPLDKRPAEGEWRGPGVCGCDRLDATDKDTVLSECSFAWR
ncbi:MAG: hypothetical protein CMP20_02655 [Rickettsiales bacterium]|nr:hypothetical protein [Rickettsiales bacterium]